MVDEHSIHKNTHADTHKMSILCTIEGARESISVSDFFFFVALYSVLRVAPKFIHRCALLFFISPIKNIQNGHYSLFMHASWWLFGISVCLC